MSDIWEQLLTPPSTTPSDDRVTYFGATDTRGKHVPFGIKREDRSRHTYVIGKTGMGKSTMLENLAIQDILAGEGMCFIDPHGGTAEKLLEYVPEHRVKDVLYFAPFDMQYPISFNVLEDVDEDKRHFVVAGLMSTFEKIWVDAWSARMAYILQNTIAALLEFPGATLLGVNRMYIDKEYRKNVIAHISDPSVRSFWVDEYSKYTDRYAQEATPAIQNKIGQFASNALVRNIIGQEQSSFDMRKLMDEKKIFIVNLSKGRVGEGNANLLGSMLITKIYLSAMSRADASPSELRALPPFFLFVDEFQNFANKSFADILSEARKYKLALTVAHQYIEQMEEEVRAAVFGNVGTMVTFRVGSYDADVLEKEFAPIFIADDLVNLGSRQVYLKLMINGVSSQPFSATTLPPVTEPAHSYRDNVIAFSRAQFSRPRQEVEDDIRDWVAKRYDDPEAEEKEQARQERRAVRDAEQQGAPARSSAPAPASRGEGVRGGAPTRRDMGRDERRADDGRSARREDRARLPQGEGVVRPTGRPPREQFGAERNVSQGSTTVARPVRPQTPPPAPFPKEKKEPTGSDLRAVLARMTQQRVPVAPPQSLPEVRREETPAIAQPSVPIKTSPAGIPLTAPTPQHQTPKPTMPRSSQEDGKGLTPEGREDLRALLRAVEQQKNSTPAQNTKSVSSSNSVHRASQTPNQTPQTNNTKRDDVLTPENVKKMLHVDKPRLP